MAAKPMLAADKEREIEARRKQIAKQKEDREKLEKEEVKSKSKKELHVRRSFRPRR